MNDLIGCRRAVRRGPWRIMLVAAMGAAWCGGVYGQSPDRVFTTDGSLTGKVVAAAADGIEIEERSGETRKIPVDQIRDVQFGGEPQSLRAARSLLARGRAADAVEEVAKVEAAELDGAEQVLLDELDFVKAAATGRAALASGADLKAAVQLVGEFLGKHPKSFHLFAMQELLGDLHARSGNTDAALAAYSTLAKGPPALKVRSAAAKAGMLFNQQKASEALAEYDAAIAIEADDPASVAQKRGAKLGKARCLAQLAKPDEAVAIVQGIVKEADPEEKELLARAYNVLGAAYQATGGKDQDALISYLTVDLVYNGSPDSHAEALAHLAELWDKAKNPERAREARKLLQDSYPGSEWAKKVASGGG